MKVRPSHGTRAATMVAVLACCLLAAGNGVAQTLLIEDAAGDATNATFGADAVDILSVSAVWDGAVIEWTFASGGQPPGDGSLRVRHEIHGTRGGESFVLGAITETDGTVEPIGAAHAATWDGANLIIRSTPGALPGASGDLTELWAATASAQNAVSINLGDGTFTSTDRGPDSGFGADLAAPNETATPEPSWQPDSDGDGLDDGWESAFFNGTEQQAGDGDPDNDGATNRVEQAAGTDPTRADTDGDGMGDGDELAHGLDPLDPTDARADIDGDGHNNSVELASGWDPRDGRSPPPNLRQSLDKISGPWEGLPTWALIMLLSLGTVLFLFVLWAAVVVSRAYLKFRGIENPQLSFLLFLVGFAPVVGPTIKFWVENALFVWSFLKQGKAAFTIRPGRKARIEAMEHGEDPMTSAGRT